MGIVLLASSTQEVALSFGIAIGVIFGLAGVMMQIAVFLRLHAETALLSDLLGDGALQTAETLQEWINSRQGGRDSLVSRHIELCERALRSSRAPSASELVAATEEQEASHWSHVLPSLLLAVPLIIGLAGTMFFLKTVLGGDAVRTIVAAGQDLSATDGSAGVKPFAEKVSTSIQLIYGGFGQAFAASLTGIVVTVVIMMVDFLFLRRAHARFVALLHQATLEIVLPLYAPPDTRLVDRVHEVTTDLVAKLTEAGDALRQCTLEVQENAVSVAETLVTMVESVNDSAKSLSDQVSRSLTYTKELAKVASSLHLLFNEGGVFPRIAVALETTSEKVDGIAGVVSKSIETLGSELRPPLEESRSGIVSLQQTLQLLESASSRDMPKVIEKASDISSILTGIKDGVLTLDKKLDTATNEVTAGNRAIGEVGSTMRLAGENIVEVINGVGTKVDQSTNEVATANQSIAEVESTVKLIGENIGGAVAGVDKKIDSVAREIPVINATVSAYELTTRAMADNLLEVLALLNALQRAASATAGDALISSTALVDIKDRTAVVTDLNAWCAAISDGINRSRELLETAVRVQEVLLTRPSVEGADMPPMAERSSS
jgi:methyl-accepting chemotaxis protein